MENGIIYFSHDANAMDDPKCMLLINQLGMEGYGIFWALVEKLRNQPDYRLPIALLPALAKKFETTPSKVEAVVRGYGLFVVDEESVFFSESLNRRMALMQKATERRKASSQKANAVRWGHSLPEKSERTPNGLRTDSDFIPIKLNKIKVKENIVKEKRTTFVVPSLQEIQDYISEKNYQVDAERFFAFYESKNWMIGKNKMKNWKMALVTWACRDKKQNRQQDEETESVYDGCLR